MALVPVLAAAAAVAALLRGGSLDRLAATHFRWLAPLLAGFAIQLGTDLFLFRRLTRVQTVAALLLSYGLVAGFLLANHRLPGLRLALVGVALNAVVIGANGAMPVSTHALRAVNSDAVRDCGVKHEPLTAQTVLPWFADVIPIPGIKQIVSVGDVVLAMGLARLVYGRTAARQSDPKPTRVSC